MAGPGPESPFLQGARAFATSLSLRLFLAVATVIAAAFAVYAWVTFRAAAREYEGAVYAGAEQVGEVIQRSTHHGMLLNQKEEVHRVISAVARTPDVEGLRIYDKDGRIMFSADSTEIGTSVDRNAEACVRCHASGKPLRALPAGDRVRIFEGRSGRIMGVINAIENAPECARAGCHVSPAEQSILGVVDVRMSLARSDTRLAVLRRQAILGAVIVMLVAGLVSAAFILRVVRRPVRRLIGGVRRVAAGDLDAEIPVESENEIGQLARSFNEMTRQLRQARGELTRWSGQLEVHLQEKAAELTRTQREIAHMDKTASLGKLAATVAHELNNPLAGILNYAKLVSRTLRESPTRHADEKEIEGYLSLIQKEADRCGVIVRNLLTFARRGGGEMGPHALNPIIQRALMLVRHHLEISDIRLETRPLAGNDQLICDADQIQQALVALLVNAVEAMPHGGTLTVGVDSDDGEVRIRVEDTGVGIPPDAVEHIFEPFYSTKEQQEGVGLGLAVVHGIVERHTGRIQVQSERGKGTRFEIILPRRPAAAREGGDGGAPSQLAAAGGST